MLYLLLLLSLPVLAYEYGSLSRPGPVDGNEFSKSAIGYEVVDWRNKGGVNWLGPVRNQSNCGSCVAFATISTLEDQLKISSGFNLQVHSLSQEALFSCGRAKCSTGWFALDAVKTVERLGVVDAACAPYTAGSTGKVPQCRSFCEGQSERTLKIKAWFAPKSVAEVKEALKRGPLLTTMLVREGFDTYAGGIFKSSMYDEVLGGHAVELVGYNDLERSWLIKNSWGELWGEHGFARISYDDAQGIAGETFGFELAPEPEGFASPLDDQYVRDSLVIQGQFSDEVRLLANAQQLRSLNCRGGCELQTESLEDGEYTLATKTSGGRLLTQRFTVINSVPDFGMSLTAPEGWDFSYPQSDRVQFIVSFTSKLLPEVLTIEIFQGSKRVFQRHYRDLLPVNRLGFNTATLPNGSYEIRAHWRVFETASAVVRLPLMIKN